MRSSIIKHSFTDRKPEGHEVGVGELTLQIWNKEAYLYTKNESGEIIQLGKGVKYFSELEDVDLTNLKDGSFLTYQDGKFKASNSIGSLTNLADVEISNPSTGDYLRYDPIYEAYRNIKPSYYLWKLLDVDVVDPEDESASYTQNDQVLVWNHETSKWITRPRRNLIGELDDVDIDLEVPPNQILSKDSDGKWRNIPLKIETDPNPTLGNNLNANTYSINNSSYRVVTKLASIPILDISYVEGDYFIIEGVDVGTNAQCILDIQFPNMRDNTTALMMLEIRQSTGDILIGGLTNIKYEDGKPISLSGNGKVDLITINVQKVNSIVTSYVTANALNLATVGNGGLPAYRYDKNRFPEIQLFDTPHLYDDYFDYVRLLLNFELENSTGRLWYEDKSDYYDETSDSFLTNAVSTDTNQKSIDVYTFGLQEYVSEFLSTSNSIDITTSSDIILDGDFTFEFYINYSLPEYYTSTTAINHVYITNQDDSFKLSYSGEVDTRLNTKIDLTLGTNTYSYTNAYKYFHREESNYVHIAIVRKLTEIGLYVNGIFQDNLDNIDDPVSSITLTTLTTSIRGLLNSVRLTNGICRYYDNFLPPNMRFGLVGGANNILDSQVFDYAFNLGEKDLEFELFY